jgi:aryl-alcohol dehydrogenase-like predicted oxidoreductase
MDRRRIGRTDLSVSRIGFGAFKIGRNEKIKYAEGYVLPDDAAAERLLRGMIDAGINYIDTAPAYGISEERVGRFVGGMRDVVISTKVGETFADGESTYDFSTAAVRGSVERSLNRLRREAIDLVFVHAHGDDLKVVTETDVVPTLIALKEAGLVRWIGLSGKTPCAAQKALAWADAIMVEYHRDDTSHEAVMRHAAARGVGVIVKKGLASGRLHADEAIGFALRGPGVSSVVVGSLKLEHMVDNLKTALMAQGGGGSSVNGGAA